MTDIIERAADLIHALYHAMDDTAQHMGGPDCKCHEAEAFVMDKDTGEALNAAFDKFTGGDEDAHEAIAELRKYKRLETPVADGEVRLAVADLERHWRETPNKELQTWLVDLARLLESQAREIERRDDLLKMATGAQRHAAARLGSGSCLADVRSALARIEEAAVETRDMKR